MRALAKIQQPIHVRLDMFVYDPVQSLPSSNIEITVGKNGEVLARERFGSDGL